MYTEAINQHVTILSSNTATTKSCKLSYLHLRVEQPNISARLLPREITQRLILLIPVGPPRLHPPLFTSQYHKPSIKACLPRGVSSQLVHNAAVFNIISIVLQYRHCARYEITLKVLVYRGLLKKYVYVLCL